MPRDELTAAVEPRPRRTTLLPEVPSVERGSRTGVVVHAAIASSVRSLLQHEPQLRDGIDDEAVHRARVATRRLRSDLRTFEGLVDPRWLTPMVEELRWLGGCLGEARDADVMLARIEAALDRVPVAQADRDALLQPLVNRRQGARRAVREMMRTSRYANLLRSLSEAACTPPLHGSVRARPEKALPGVVRKRWRALRREVRAAGKRPPAEQLHKIRIRAKRVRYAAEAVSPAFGRPARRFAQRMEEVQELLGRHHDAVVASAWLRERARGADPAMAFLAGELAGLEAAEAEAIERAWPKTWKRARRKRHREWL